jgi:hypothetical protein
LKSSTSLMDRPHRPDAISPKINVGLLGRQSSTSWVPTNELGPHSDRGTSESLPSKWVHQTARDSGWSQ